MEIRRVSPGQGVEWFKQAIDLGARNPRAVFGAALLLIATLYGVTLLMVLAMSLLVAAPVPGQAPELGRVMAVAMPLFVLMMLLIPVLFGGLMHVIREAEAGRPVRALDLYAPLRAGQGKRLSLLGLVQIALALLGGVLMVALAGGDYWQQYQQALQSMMSSGQVGAMPQPRHPGLLFVVQMLFNYFSYALMLLAIPLMLFSRRPLGAALRDSLRASVSNVGAHLVAGLLFIGAMIAAGIVVVLVAGLLGVLGNAIHASIGTLLVAVVLLGFAAAMLVLVAGGAYLAWRDTFGDAGSAHASPPQVHGIEA